MPRKDREWWPLMVAVTRARQDVASLEANLARARERLRDAEGALDDAVTARINEAAEY